MRRYIFALIAFTLALAPLHQPVRADAARYTIENLGNVAGLMPTVTGINASGEVSGYVSPATGARAVKFSAGTWSYVEGLGTTRSEAYGINDAGVIVGHRFTAGGDRGFRAQNGVVQDIEPLAGGTFTKAFAINNAGVVVGYGNSTAGNVAFSAAPDAAAVALPTLGGFLTVACGINAQGQIAGSAFNGDFIQHAIRIEPGATTLADLGSLIGGDGNSAACAIDADGRVGGQSDAPGGAHAFRFGPSLADLDTFGSSTSNTEAMAGGTSVGFYTAAAGPRAFVHTDADGTIDLNSLVEDAAGWVLKAAKAINADGRIVGEGTFNGTPAVFRLTRISSTPADTTAPVISSVTATPSTVSRPNGTLVPVTVAVVVRDDVDPAPVCSLTGITATATTADDYAITGQLSGVVRAVGGRSYTLTVTCTDAAGNSREGSTLVDVTADTKAPFISQISATPSLIWPPNGKMVAVSVSVAATDDVTGEPVCSLNSIRGAAASDYTITGPRSASVRADKNHDGSARVYWLTVKCSDGAGNKSFASVTVTVANKDPQSAKEIAKLTSISKSSLGDVRKK